MSAASPEPGRRDSSVTCPRCLLTFAPSESTSVPPSPPSDAPGTATMLPDGPAPPPPVSPAPAPPPQRLGRFEVRRFIGEGTFGRVYEAYDTALHRMVALKVAKHEQLSSPR